jgi:hypothetical protein
VLKASESVCRLCYVKDSFDGAALVKATARFSGRDKLDAMAHHRAAALWDWRDNAARKEDESTGYVMSNHFIFKIALECPNNIEELIQMCQGGIFGDSAPPLVVKYADEILSLLKQTNTDLISKPATKSHTNTSPNTVFTFTPHIGINDDIIEDYVPSTTTVTASTKPSLSASEVHKVASWINPFEHGSKHAEYDDESAQFAEKVRIELAQRPFMPLVQRIFQEQKEAAAKRIEFPNIEVRQGMAESTEEEGPIIEDQAGDRLSNDVDSQLNVNTTHFTFCTYQVVSCGEL